MLRAQSIELNQRVEELERKARKLAGHEFNLGSPKQLQMVLYNEYKITSV